MLFRQVKRDLSLGLILIKRLNFFPSTLKLREETHEQAEEEEGEDLVSKAEAEFFKIVEAEKKALQEAENKRFAAFAEVKQAIAQEGVTHEEYQEGESESVKQSEEVRTFYGLCDHFDKVWACDSMARVNSARNPFLDSCIRPLSACSSRFFLSHFNLIRSLVTRLYRKSHKWKTKCMQN